MVKWDNGSGAPLPDVYYESFYKREGRKDWSVGTADYGGRKTDFYYENFSEREGRNDYRVGEKIASYIPFLRKIQATDLGESILLHAAEILSNE